jgi:hypothetical protein
MFAQFLEEFLPLKETNPNFRVLTGAALGQVMGHLNSALL